MPPTTHAMERCVCTSTIHFETTSKHWSLTHVTPPKCP